LSKVPLPVKMAAYKFDYKFRILHFSDTSFLENIFEGQAHLQFAVVDGGVCHFS